MDGIAIGLLVAALLLFLLSTRQFALWMRASILLASIASLTGAGLVAAQMEGHYGLFAMLEDACRHIGDPTHSALAIALSRNEESATRYVIPVLDIFFAACVGLGLVAALALTPGEAIERIVRPLMMTLIGAILGAALTLTIVTVGFGGVTKQRAYISRVAASDIHDGDTLSMGDISLRLYGLDTPELDQICFADERTVPCGLEARNRLSALLANHIVQCFQRVDTHNPPSESFGRPVLQCELRVDGRPPIDVAGIMIAEGYGIQYRNQDMGYTAESERGSNSGLLATCMLRPDFWRQRDHSVRDAFLAGRMSEVPPEARVGHCAA